MAKTVEVEEKVVPSKVRVQLIKKNSMLPSILSGCRKTVSPLTDSVSGKKRVPLTEAQKDELYPDLIAGWDKTNPRTVNLQLEEKWWNEYGIKLTSEELTIDTNTKRGMLDYLVLRDTKEVANSLGDTRKNPKAKWVLIDEATESEHKLKIFEEKGKAYEIIASLKTDEDKLEFMKVLGIETIEGFEGMPIDAIPPRAISASLYTYADKMYDYVVKMHKDTNKSKTERILLYDALKLKILTEEAEGILFKDKFIGANRDLAILYLMNVDHQQVKIAIQKQVEMKQQQSK